MQVDELTQLRHILRGFVGNATNIVVKNQQGRGRMAVQGKFLNIDHGAISDAANLVQPVAALMLDLSRAFFPAAKHQISSARSTRSAHNQGVKTKRKHKVFWVRAPGGPSVESRISLETIREKILLGYEGCTNMNSKYPYCVILAEG